MPVPGVVRASPRPGGALRDPRGQAVAPLGAGSPSSPGRPSATAPSPAVRHGRVAGGAVFVGRAVAFSGGALE